MKKTRTVIGIDQGTANLGVAVNRTIDDGGIRVSKLGVCHWPGNSFRGAIEVFGTLVRLIQALPDEIRLVVLEGRAYGMATRKTSTGATAGYNMAGLWHVDTMIQYYCAAERIPFLVAAPCSWKRFVGGKGKGRMTKPEVQATMKAQGLYSKDKDIQDAIALSVLGVAKVLHDDGDREQLAASFDEEQVKYMRVQFRTQVQDDFSLEWPGRRR